MKLALITSFPPSKVTLSEYGYHLVKHFRERPGVTQVLVLTDISAKPIALDFTTAGAKVTVIHCWKFNSYTNFFSINKVVQEQKPDAILVNLQFLKFGDKKIPAALGLLLPGYFSFKKIPTIALLHNILEQVDLSKAGFTKNKILQSIYTFIGSSLTRCVLKADFVSVTLEKYVSLLQEKYKKDNIIHVPHGSFELPPAPQHQKSEPHMAKKIMTFGKFGTYKKVEILIEAVVMLRKKYKQKLEVIVAGTDNPNTPGYLASVAKKYQDIADLTFTGYVEEQDVPMLFKQSSVVVFPYTATTGSSGVLHQAGSYAKAVVLPDLGDLSLLIQKEGYGGAFFTPNNVESLANAIDRVIGDDTHRIALEKQNYKAASALPMSVITDMFLTKFQEIIAKK